MGANIFDISNQLFFPYKGLAFKLQIFIILLGELIKAADFILTQKKRKSIGLICFLVSFYNIHLIFTLTPN